MKVYESDIRILSDLRDSDLLNATELSRLDRSLEARKSRMTHGGPTSDDLTSDAMEHQARAFRARIDSVFGPAMGQRVISALHYVTWMVRPLRRALSRRAVTKNREFRLK
jgi:hypothetical protein